MIQKTIDELKDSHTPSAIEERLGSGLKHSYLKDFIYGAIDGTVTTFAVVSGVAGAGLSMKVVIILGVANLIGDGFSMGVSNFIGTRAEEKRRDKARKIEEEHITQVPEGEREEIRQIFAAKGFEGKDLEKAVDVITADADRWINTMLQEELGFALEGPSAIRAGVSTFGAFVCIGVIPLIPFLLLLIIPDLPLDPYIWSSWLTGLAFFIVGVLKAPFVGERWYEGGLETVSVGGIAAGLAYLVGYFLKGIAG